MIVGSLHEPVAWSGPTLFFPVSKVARGCDFGFAFGTELFIPFPESTVLGAEDAAKAAGTKGRGCDFGFSFSPDLLVPPPEGVLFGPESKALVAETMDRGCDFGVGFGPDLLVLPAESAVLRAGAGAAAGFGSP